jgi:hypothetical protein
MYKRQVPDDNSLEQERARLVALGAKWRRGEGIIVRKASSPRKVRLGKDSPSVVESERLPPMLVAPPLSRSLDPLTPLSALQLPRSPACPVPVPTAPTTTSSPTEPWPGCCCWPSCPRSPLPLPAPGVATPLPLPRGNETRDSWSLRLAPPPTRSANCRWSCRTRSHEVLRSYYPHYCVIKHVVGQRLSIPDRLTSAKCAMPVSSYHSSFLLFRLAKQFHSTDKPIGNVQLLPRAQCNPYNCSSVG